MGNTLFGVRATHSDGFGPTSTILNVMASDGHEALDVVNGVDDYELYDESIQRAIVDGDISDHRVMRKYENYIYEQNVLDPGRDEYEYGDPCPECGHSGHFHETCEAHGMSHFDDDGNVIDFDWELFDDPLYVECPECNTVLMDKLP